jgi:DNA-binding transcriptional regulator GbsR (MarR family)
MTDTDSTDPPTNEELAEQLERVVELTKKLAETQRALTTRLDDNEEGISTMLRAIEQQQKHLSELLDSIDANDIPESPPAERLSDGDGLDSMPDYFR